MRKLLPSILFIFLLINIAHAAIIQGTIYDLELNQVNNVIIEVDSTPKQRLVSNNGEYSFNLPKGSYTITATSYFNKEENTLQEEITIESDGEYTLDLFLFPNLEDIDPLDFDIGKDLEEPKNNKTWIYILIIALIIILIVILKFKPKKVIKLKEEEKEKLKEEEKEIEKEKVVEEKEIEEKKDIEEKTEIKEEIEPDEILEKVYNIIKKEKRITQKELRKQINLSESKISLVISQLEAEDKIKKIKKGRTNILIFK